MIQKIKYLFLFSLLSQAFALGRTMQIAYAYGASIITDGYAIGLIGPSLALGVWIGLIQATFMPLYFRNLKNSLVAENERLASSALSLTVIVSALIILLLIGFSNPIEAFFSSQSTGSMAKEFIVTLAAATALMLTADMMGLILNCKNKFSIVPISQILGTGLTVVSFYLLPRENNLHLIVSLYIGLIFQNLILFIFCLKHRLIHLQNWSVATFPVGVMAKNSAQIIPALVMANAFYALIQSYAANTEIGALSIFNYALKFHLASFQALLITINSFFLAHFSQLVAENQMGPLRKNIHSSLLALAGVTISLFVGVYIFGDGFVRLTLHRGELTLSDAQKIAGVWLILTLSFFPSAVNALYTKVFLAVSKPILWSITTGISFFAVIAIQRFNILDSSLSGLAMTVIFSHAATLPFIVWIHKKYLFRPDQP